MILVGQKSTSFDGVRSSVSRDAAIIAHCHFSFAKELRRCLFFCSET
jgi:hypothetical protein